MKKIAFLASGSGSLVETILKAISQSILGEIVPALLISDRKSKSIEIGEAHGLKTHVLEYNGFESRESFSDAILEIFLKDNIDFCFLTFDRLLSGQILEKYKNRLINIHPSLLPSFPGYNTVKNAQEYGTRFVGATCHFVDKGTDTGPIINQAVMPISSNESIESINERLYKLRQQLSVQALFAYMNNKITVKGRNVIIDGASYDNLSINPYLNIPNFDKFLKSL